MNKISSRDIRLFVAGALAFSGLRALLEIPYYLSLSSDLSVSRVLVLISGAIVTSLALPMGIGIFLGRWSAFFWAQVYLWMKIGAGCVTVPVFWYFFHQKAAHMTLRIVPEMLVTAVLLGLIFWTTSERFRYEPDAV